MVDRGCSPRRWAHLGAVWCEGGAVAEAFYDLPAEVRRVAAAAGLSCAAPGFAGVTSAPALELARALVGLGRGVDPHGLVRLAGDAGSLGYELLLEADRASMVVGSGVRSESRLLGCLANVANEVCWGSGVSVLEGLTRAEYGAWEGVGGAGAVWEACWLQLRVVGRPVGRRAFFDGVTARSLGVGGRALLEGVVEVLEVSVSGE